MRTIGNCVNYFCERAKLVFALGTAISAGMAVKAHLSSQGNTQASRALFKASPPIFLGFSAIFGILAVMFGVKQSAQKSLFARDLEFIRTTIIENHPGIYDVLNPYFSSSLAKSYEIAKQQLGRTYTAAQKAQVLKDFGKSFQDAHLWVQYDFAKTAQAAKAPQRAFDLQILQDGVVWVDIPTFQPSNEQKQKFDEIVQTLSQFRDQTLVFDLRGNGGGNSALGTGLLKALFGQEYTEHHLAELNRNVRVEWRASQGNLEHVQQFIPLFTQQFGPTHPAIEWAKNAIQGMGDAIARGAQYYSVLASETSSRGGKADNAFKGRIIAIVDKGCGSACLDFLDGLKALQPNAVLIGETTGADSAYMELRTVRLPSGQGSFGFPIKVYRNRPRGHNVPFVPDIAYTEDLRDTAALQQFVLKDLSCLSN